MDSSVPRTSRRAFVTDASLFVAAATLAGCARPQPPGAVSPAAQTADGWDLAWTATVAAATDRAVFDWPALGDPAGPIVLELAARYLENCAAAYGRHPYDARVVLNIRTQAVPAALTDDAWERHALGAEYDVKDPATQKPATRNPFWHRAPDPAPGITLPTLKDLLGKNAIVLVCDFALTHLAHRLATKSGRDAVAVHHELRQSFVPGAFAVPSGIFGLARAQNSGCAYIRTS